VLEEGARQRIEDEEEDEDERQTKWKRWFGLG